MTTATRKSTRVATGPDSRQAWILVFGLGLVMAISFGVTLSAFSVFTLPIMDTFHSSQAQAAGIATFFMVTMTLAMPAAGWLLDHVAPRPVMAGGALVTGLGYLIAARSGNIDAFTAAIAVCGIGVGLSTYVPAFTLVARWISLKRQGLAFGILIALTSVGGMVFPVLLTRMTAAWGLRVTMDAGAAMILLICVPLLLFLARMPDKPLVAGPDPKDEAVDGYGIISVLRMPQYWLWIVMWLLIVMSGLSILVGLVPYLISIDYSASDAALVYASIGAATIVGSLLFGVLSERWGAKYTLLIGAVLSSVGLLSLLAASHPALGLVAVVLFSILWGTTFNLVNQLSPALLMELIGQHNYGSMLGIGNLISGLGAAVGPIAFGYFVDTTKSYVLPLSLCIALMLAALLPIALLRRPSQRMRESPVSQP